MEAVLEGHLTPGHCESMKGSDHWLNALARLDRDDAIDSLKWVLVCANSVSFEGARLWVRGRCRPFVAIEQV